MVALFLKVKYGVLVLVYGCHIEIEGHHAIKMSYTFFFCYGTSVNPSSQSTSWYAYFLFIPVFFTMTHLNHVPTLHKGYLWMSV